MGEDASVLCGAGGLRLAANAAWLARAAALKVLAAAFQPGISLVAQTFAGHSVAASRVFPRARSFGRAPVVRQGGFWYLHHIGWTEGAAINRTTSAATSSGTTATSGNAGVPCLTTGGSVRLRGAALAPGTTGARATSGSRWARCFPVAAAPASESEYHRQC